MNIDLMPILEAVLALAAALITYKLLPWIKARTTIEQQTLLAATIKTLVFAAEQLYGAMSGEKKLQYVCDELTKRGFEVDRAQIEATVNEFFGKITNTEIVQGVDVEDMTDEQIREVLLQTGMTQEQIDACDTREKLEEALFRDAQYACDAETIPPTGGGAA